MVKDPIGSVYLPWSHRQNTAKLISLQYAYTLCLPYGTHPVSVLCLCIPLQPLYSLFIGKVDLDPLVFQPL
ncbi:uncharacterized protein MONOS_17586 [Monocercomonoides exilis]|uniref:uncharacterized protein n=1 Tax=Monocercomonoides exilis TaxID=2049356 RepID=UPI003559A39D|nr:hypothetical protein MONOS_17586 [Monocercomonoides exilis]